MASQLNDNRAPYWVCSVILCIAIIAQLAIYKILRSHVLEHLHLKEIWAHWHSKKSSEVVTRGLTNPSPSASPSINSVEMDLFQMEKHSDTNSIHIAVAPTPTDSEPEVQNSEESKHIEAV